MSNSTANETLHVYDLPEGKAHMMVRPDETLILVSDLGEPVATMADLGDAIRDLLDMGLDPTPVADAAWERIKRRKLERSLAQEARDELSLALSQAGVGHAADVVMIGGGNVTVTMTVDEARALCDRLAGEVG